jgi:ComF family protein
MLSDLLQLVFPRLCVTCNNTLHKNENHICSACLIDLPQTRFHETLDNPLAKTFWGRLSIEHAFSFLYFRKGNSVQHILHEIKYKNNTELAHFIGSYYGSILAEAGVKLDGIVAIPLHRDKLRKRGYNQSELIVNGMCQSMQVENLSPYIERLSATETQTKKSRFARWENVEDVFQLKELTSFTQKHLLLMDDVITTGATIEACGKQILNAPQSKLSVASIAFATN